MNAFEINLVISGALLIGYVAVALFFLRFWTRTRDRLFMLFALAFAILALQRLMLMLSDRLTENLTHLYGMRLLAFLMILWGIIEKNRASTRRA